MEIHPNDIIVIPADMEVPTDFPYDYHKIKYLHSPSIVRSGHMLMTNTAILQLPKSTLVSGILSLLGISKPKEKEKDSEEHKDIFFRHIRIMNDKTGEFYHNRGASVLVDLRAGEGRLFFSFATCNHRDNFNKLIAHCVCKDRMKKGLVYECINYDPSISILQNIYLAIGVMEGHYSLTDFDWQDILPELYGTYTADQKVSLGTLRRLIRDKSQD